MREVFQTEASVRKTSRPLSPHRILARNNYELSITNYSDDCTSISDGAVTHDSGTVAFVAVSNVTDQGLTNHIQS